jgi:hypothetical protein
VTAVSLPDVVTAAGAYPDMPTAVYHADPVDGGSLSSTGARMLLAPSCPAKFRWWADNPQPPKRDFDYGHAAHGEVLGIGDQLVVVDAADWRTKDAKAARDEAYANGDVPILTAEWEQVQAMATQVREHPVAGRLLSPDRGGQAELSLFWFDDLFGVWRRARLDWFVDRFIVDYKTARAIDDESASRAMAEYFYHQQLDWYRAGTQAVGLAGDDCAGLLVLQEKTPPYLVRVVRPDARAMRAAADRNRKALDVYATCQATGEWPGYPDMFEGPGFPLPGWAEHKHEVAKDRGDFDIDWQLPLPKETEQ